MLALFFEKRICGCGRRCLMEGKDTLVNGKARRLDEAGCVAWGGLGDRKMHEFEGRAEVLLSAV